MRVHACWKIAEPKNTNLIPRYFAPQFRNGGKCILKVLIYTENLQNIFEKSFDSIK